MKAIITVGIPASGKSSYFEELGVESGYWFQVERDILRMCLFGGEFKQDYKFSRHKEKQVTELQEKMIRDKAQDNYNLYISDTNLNTKTRNRLVALCKELGYEVEIKEFPISFEEALKRDSKRGRDSVGKQVILGMWKKWLEYKNTKKYVQSGRKSLAYIFDIDGTLADHKGVRSPFDYSKVSHDKPMESVKAVYEALKNDGYWIVVVSGRDSVCRQDTEEWLSNNEIEYDELFMRPEGNTEKDYKIKQRIFWKDIVPRYDVMGVFDDRLQVCRMWHSIGVPVFKVGCPDEEF